jgi:hypothetical protein
VVRRNAPLRVEWIDRGLSVLTFALHHSDVVALLDDGSLRRWRRLNSRWQEISRTKSSAGREGFRLRRGSPAGIHKTHATTQLGYNNAIAVGDDWIYFGVGKILQQLVRI